MADIDPYDPLVPDKKLLNEVKYSARDFATMADHLIRMIKTEYGEEYNDYTQTAVAIMLRDLICWAFVNVQWYMDRSASDLYLRTARTPAAVSAIVEQIGYKMSPAASSGGTCVMTFEEGTTGPFELKDRWQFQGPNGLKFETYSKKLVPQALDPGETVSVGVRQGETRIATFTSDGSKNQLYRMTGVSEGKFLAYNTTEIWVDGQLWEERDFLEFKTGIPDGNIYEINYLASPPTVRFGDGIAGNVPSDTAEIKIQYIVIDGKSGNVARDTILQSVDTLFIGGEQVSFTVTNPERTSGGGDPESIESAKRLAPRSFAARGAAITKDDYEALSESFSDPTYGAPVRAYAHSPRSSYSDVIFNSLVVDIETALETYVELVESIEEDVIAAGNGLDTILESMTESTDVLATLQSSLESSIASAISLGTGARDASVTAGSAASNSKDRTDSATASIDGLITWIDDSTTISAEDKDVLLNGNDSGVNGLNNINSDVSVAGAEALAASTKAGESVQALDTQIDTHLNEASGYIVDDLVEQIDSLNSDISSMDSTINDDTTGIIALLEQLSGSAASMSDEINAIVASMRDRIAEIFEDECQSNFVQVPILSADSDGNYVSPSVGLRGSLQQYLDTVKEVTQVVEVVDGSYILVPADINVEMEIWPVYVNDEVVAQVERVISRLLKGRRFEQPLYLSDLYEVIKLSSNGIKRFNVEIVGPVSTPSVIDNGNLVPGDDKVIVEGVVNVSVVGS